MDNSRTRKTNATYFTNRGIFFENAPALLKGAQGSSAKWIDVVTTKGFSDRLRKWRERFPSNPNKEELQRRLQYISKSLPNEISTNERWIHEFMEWSDTVPENGSHAGAWLPISAYLRGIRAAIENFEIERHLNFIEALANIDKQILKTPTEEYITYWLKTIFPWIDFADEEKYSYDDFIVIKYLLWAVLAQFTYYGLSGIDLSSIKTKMRDRKENVLQNALPILENGKLILSSEMSIRYLKNELCKKGTKDTYIDLSCAMECSEKTVKRIRNGEAQLKPQHLYSLHSIPVITGAENLPNPNTIFINLWTKAQKEYDGDIHRMVENYRQYENVVEHVHTLFHEFVNSGKICVPNKTRLVDR